MMTLLVRLSERLHVDIRSDVFAVIRPIFPNERSKPIGILRVHRHRDECFDFDDTRGAGSGLS